MRELWRKLRNNRNQLDEDLAEELHFHIEERADELEAIGMPRSKALRQARLELGTPLAIREESKDQWSFGWIEDWYTDTLHAARGFAKQPGFVIAAVLSFGLGIGVNLALFGLSTQLIFRDPSVHDASNLYSVRLAGSSHIEPNAFKTLRESQALPNVTGYSMVNDLNWRNGEESLRLFGIAVDSRYFAITGTPLAQGRGIDDKQTFTAVISDNFWRNHLGQDPQAIGKPLWINGSAHTILGILPADFRTIIGFGFAPDLFIPATSAMPLQILAGLPRNTSKQEANDRALAAGRSLDATNPIPQDSYAQNVQVASLAGVDRLRFILGPSGAAVIALIGFMFLLVLLIACANVASLLLARAAARSQELAIRSSLGATRIRLLRQLLAETLLLSLGGALAGIALYAVFTGSIGTVPLPLPIPISLSAETNWTSLAYAILLAIFAALLAGLTPAWRASRNSLSNTLKASEHQVAAPSLKLRRWLLGAQIAASILLLSTGLLFLRNLAHTTSLDPGFRLDTLWARMTLVPTQFPQSDRIGVFTQDALQRLRADARIESAAFVLVVPFNDQSTNRTNIRTEGGTAEANYRFNHNIVSSAYFATIGLPLIAGREFTDTSSDQDSVILSASLARRLFDRQSPVGRRIFVDSQAGFKPCAVIGVAGDAKQMSFGEVEPLTMYRALASNKTWRTQIDFLARPRAASAETAKAMRTLLLNLNPASAVEARRLADSLGLALLPSQAGAIIFGALGLLGLALSAVGLHGTVSFSVRQRSSEIGLRMALGASPPQILAMIVKENAFTLLCGSLIGLALAIAVAQPLAIFLVPGLGASEPTSLAAILLGIAMVALIAILGPARRAMRIDPLEALRSS